MISREQTLPHGKGLFHVLDLGAFIDAHACQFAAHVAHGGAVAGHAYQPAFRDQRLQSRLHCGGIDPPLLSERAC